MHPLDPPNAVAANAFESVTFVDIAKHSVSGESPNVDFERGQPQPNEEFILTGPICKGRPAPLRRPSELPEPGTLKLQLSLGRKLGSGRVARVYEATVDYANSSPELQQMILPPLAVKVSRRYDARHLAKEAYYYDEMECLHGSVIPRYYGFYQTEIPPDLELRPWKRDSVRSKSKRTPRPTKLSILIMERLGGLMPLGEDLPDDLEDELNSLYSNLCTLGVDHDDIRYYNILKAPPSDSLLPSLPSPLTQRTYEWRLIDFNKACKSNNVQSCFENYYWTYLHRLLYNLPWNDIWEPWHF
ncbi:hypothetical protein QCA50_015039 [Cerrena zonata]|uniref:Protein kinase domain-containing protein n=1 Tax=Cerrena zonata TaxID=2478898 RepID=A0AAW0FQY7_9APHY